MSNTVPPIGFDNETDELLCPHCEEFIHHSPSHDISLDGMGLMAVPDVYSCWECGYEYVE